MSTQYQKFSGVCALLAGVAGLLYLILFVILRNPAALLPSIALLAVGLFTSAVWIGLYHRTRIVDEGFALWGLLLGVGGAGGAAIHAAFDVNNNLHPPAVPFNYANPIDPRGFLTFAVTGLALIVLSWLIVRSSVLPQVVGFIGIFAGVLLILLYLVYLTILNATHPLVLVLILITGLLQPIWYLWLGWVFLQDKTPSSLVTSIPKER